MTFTASTQPSNNVDVLFVGGGLSGCLAAWRLKALQPELRVLVLEAATNPSPRTWSFHEGDSEATPWIRELASASWPETQTRFPGEAPRTIARKYFSIRSEDFFDRVKRDLGPSLRMGVRVESFTATSAVLQSGEKISARVVLDSRGLPFAQMQNTAYQKFVGLFVRLNRPHSLRGPVIMDATVPQTDGYRFVYTLPWGPQDLLIEDTYYSNTPEIDRPRIEREILEYAAAQGFEVESVTGSEQESLPIPLLRDFIRPGWRRSDVPTIGLAAGLFHMTTGYSLPEAVRVAECLSRHQDWRPQAVHAVLSEFVREKRPHDGFFLMLNRMMFLAAPGPIRYRILQRFYRFSEETIERFYAGRLSASDRLKMVVGKPPVPMWKALQSAFFPAKSVGNVSHF